MPASSKKKVAGETKAPGEQRALGETDDDAKLIFGTVYSLRNMVKKLGGEDDRYVFRLTDISELTFNQLSILQNISVQTTLLRNTHESQICHVD